MKQVIALTTLAGATAHAQDIQLTIDIPRLDVAEYHRPYVAAWIEKSDNSHLADLLVWYDTKMKDGGGEKWLKDIRQWWRKSGRSLDLPIDGLSGPTKPVGTHEVTIPAKIAEKLTPSSEAYTLIVEASREVGGRELVKIPFSWDGKSAVNESATGKTELRKITLKILPK